MKFIKPEAPASNKDRVKYEGTLYKGIIFEEMGGNVKKTTTITVILVSGFLLLILFFLSGKLHGTSGYKEGVKWYYNKEFERETMGGRFVGEVYFSIDGRCVSIKADE